MSKLLNYDQLKTISDPDLLEMYKDLIIKDSMDSFTPATEIDLKNKTIVESEILNRMGHMHIV